MGLAEKEFGYLAFGVSFSFGGMFAYSCSCVRCWAVVLLAGWSSPPFTFRPMHISHYPSSIFMFVSPCYPFVQLMS